MTPPGTVRGGFAVEADGVRGHACDAADPARRLAVELLLDGWPIDLARADDFAPEAAGIGDGCCGFGFRLSRAVLDAGGLVEVRVANTGEAVGGAVEIGGRGGAPAAGGRVEWAGGLRLTGWVEAAPPGEASRVRLLVERRAVAECEARGFAAARQGALRRMKARFDLALPVPFADGRVHLVTAVDGRGRELAGSPCAVLCFPDGLRDALLRAGHLDDGDPRAELVDRLLPRSVGFADVEAWAARFPAPAPAPEPAMSGRGAAVAVLMLGGASAATLASLDEQDHASWLAIAAPEADGPATFDPAACRAALAAEPGLGAVAVLPAGSRLRPRALARLAALAVEGSVYADALLRAEGGDLPLLWPAFDAVRQSEQGYAALAFAAPASAVSAALARGASSSFALFDRLAAERVPVHLPEILVELPRPHPGLGAALAAVWIDGARGGAVPTEPDRRTGLPAVSVRRAAPRLASRGASTAVAVIQPEARPPDVAGIAAALPDAEDRLIVSHRPLPTPAGWRNVVVPGARNPSRLRNAALREAGAARCLLLDAGVEPADGEAVGEVMSMVSGRAVSSRAVAAGGLLLDGDGLLLSAGTVLGPGFGAAPAFAGLDPDAGGYAGALSVARCCGALDAAAMLVDRAAVAAVGGFDDAAFPEHHGPADLCLRLRAAGGRLVVTPRARFVRSRAWRAPGTDEGARAELAALRSRWGRELLDDPFYHPALNLDGAPFAGLAWPPRPREPRRPEPPTPSSDPETP